MRDWIDIKNTMSRDDFCRRHAYPFFLIVDGLESDDVEFSTSVVGVPRRPQNGAAPSVLPIRKMGTNPFRDRVLVGRARNCDVVLHDASVSKLHAEVRPQGIDAAELTDKESRNGTQINGQAVLAKTTKPVRSGDRISFGATTLLFLSPSALYDML